MRLSNFGLANGVLSNGTLDFSVAFSRTGPTDQATPELSGGFLASPGGSLHGGSEMGQAGEVGVDTLGDLSASLISSLSCATDTVITMPLSFQPEVELSDVRLRD